MKMGLSDYIEALEAERRKILVFSKELPLSLDLLAHAIEASRLQLRGRTTSSPECSSGQTSPEEGPVLEELTFMPVKKKRTLFSDPEEDDEDDDNEPLSHKPKIISKDHRKSDWLRSVQLWNNNPQSSPLNEEDNITHRKKISVLEVIKEDDGGAFQPFHREATSFGNTRTASTANKASSSPAPALAPPTATGSKKKEGHNSKRKQRRCWSQDLHKRFLSALHQLGGADFATPKQIRELMKVEGLTNDEVKSHLQKFRLHTRRPSSMIDNNNNGDSQMAPFVLVGNFIVQRPPPPEHAAVVATSKVSPEIYAPVGVPAKGGRRHELDLEKCYCWGGSNSEDSEVADHSNSYSSTHI